MAGAFIRIYMVNCFKMVKLCENFKPLHKLGVYAQLMPRIACQVLSSFVSR